MRVICAGHANWDVTLQVDHLPAADSEARIRDRRTGGGGSAANTAVALSRLDVSAAIVASVGDDRDGYRTRAELSDAGVDTTGLQVVDGLTAVKYLVVAPDGEAFVLGTDGVNEAVEPDELSDSFLERADHLHLTGQDPDTAATLARRAHEHGLCMSFDPGRRGTDRTYDETLALADIVFLNRREADQITVPDNRIVVRKHGSGGATAETPDGKYHHAGFPIEAVDTTGAGDAFAAGFIATLLAEGEYSRALAVGNACGALTASAEGTRPGLSWDAVDALLDSE